MGTDDTVVAFRQWHTAADLAELEGVSERTIYRRLARGDVEKRETSDGTRYRLAGTDSTDSHDTDTDSRSVSNSRGAGTDTPVSTDTESVSSVSEWTSLVGELTDRIAELERQVGRLEATNNQLRDRLDDEDTADTDAADSRPSYASVLVDMLDGERSIDEVRAFKRRHGNE